MALGPFVKSGMRDLGLRLDARGLMDLAEARERVRAVNVAVRGPSHVLPGQQFQPTDFDYLWAALLSLEDADEFVREASRIEWKFSPRGFDNIAPAERYGDAIVPWLSRMVDDSGVIAPHPWCLSPCLLAIGTKASLEVVLRMRDPQSSERIREWLRRHGNTALGELARAGNARAKQLFSRMGVALDEAAILATFDEAAAGEIGEYMPWPSLRASVGHFELHAMRLIAARSKKGNDWGVLIEVVQGDILGDPEEIRWPATIQYYRYGSKVPIGGRYLFDGRPIGIKVSKARRVVGPKGTKPFVLDESSLPRASCAPIEDWPSVLAIRARLSRDPDAFWVDAKSLAKKELQLKDPEVIVTTDRFEHAVDKPSESKTYRSLAAAITHRDPSLFVTGFPNTSWRDLV